MPMSTMDGAGPCSAITRPYDSPRSYTWAVIFIRLAGFFFAFVQITLVLRLMLPFVEVPEALVEYVPTLVEITDIWLAPVLAVMERFEISGVAESLAAAGETTVSGPEEFEPVVLVAMLFWAVVAMFGLFVMKLIFRPVG